MNERCPECGLTFGREPGYFTGAMYISYTLAVLVLLPLAGLIWILTRWELEWAILSASLLFLLFVPAIFRLSRVVYMHLDRSFDQFARTSDGT